MTDERLEQRILTVLRRQPRMTFLSLAESIADHRWGDLLTALNRLKLRQWIDLQPLQWDYEILLLHIRRRAG